jgi:hypothetical protein
MALASARVGDAVAVKAVFETVNRFVVIGEELISLATGWSLASWPEAGIQNRKAKSASAEVLVRKVIIVTVSANARDTKTQSTKGAKRRSTSIYAEG